MTNEVLPAAVRLYFRGERLEMLAILAGALVLTVAAGALYAFMRDGFARGFAAAVVLAALLLSVVVASVLRRDPRLQAEIEAGLRGPGAAEVVRTEAARVREVIRKYPYYRYGALVLGFATLASAALTRRGWVHGTAAGTLVLVVAQLAIDHYSERRASRYASQLDSALESLRESRPRP